MSVTAKTARVIARRVGRAARARRVTPVYVKCCIVVDCCSRDNGDVNVTMTVVLFHLREMYIAVVLVAVVFVNHRPVTDTKAWSPGASVLAETLDDGDDERSQHHGCGRTCDAGGSRRRWRTMV